MKYLGVDVGTERVGLALSDDSGRVAFPLAVIPRDKCVKEMRRLIKERGIDGMVFGESLNVDGAENPVMADVREIAGALEGVSVFFEPEQFSTRAASRLGEGTDAQAAAVILQSYLDRFSSDNSVDFE